MTDFVDASEIFEKVKREATAKRQAEAEGVWPVMDEAAYYGLAGDVVRAITPDSESDPVAILALYLAAFGNIVGNAPYYLVESDQHTANLFIALVGVSAKGRKGTASSRVRAITKIADETWLSERTASGLSSGEGLIYAVLRPRRPGQTADDCRSGVCWRSQGNGAARQ